VLNVLALDIEGGHGGSSKSLYTSILHLDRTRFSVEVWCKRDGIQDRYAEIGVPCHVKPNMPKVSALPKVSRNIFVHLRFLFEFIRAHRFRTELLLEINSRFDVVHFNHEALAWLGLWLRSKTSAGFVFHNRTMLRDTLFARAQIFAMRSASDDLIYITENEQKNVQLLGIKDRGNVIYNPVKSGGESPKLYQWPDDAKQFRVCCLSNYSWNRGGDRLIEVATVLKSWNQTDVQFVMIGDQMLTGSLPGELGQIAECGGDLSNYAAHRDVAEMFLFLGYVSNPESILISCSVVTKLSRENNPWGRDILEGMLMAKPIIGIGTYDGFVKDGATGYLLHDYDAVRIAEKIVYLKNNPGKAIQMGKSARKLVEDKCNGFERARDLSKVWCNVNSLRNCR